MTLSFQPQFPLTVTKIWHNIILLRLNQMIIIPYFAVQVPMGFFKVWRWASTWTLNKEGKKLWFSKVWGWAVIQVWVIGRWNMVSYNKCLTGKAFPLFATVISGSATIVPLCELVLHSREVSVNVWIAQMEPSNATLTSFMFVLKHKFTCKIKTNVSLH